MTVRSRSGDVVLAAVCILLAATLVTPPSAAAPRRPANDDRGQARILHRSTGSLTQTTVGATPQAHLGENSNQASVWFTWRATHTGWEAFDTRGSQAATWLIAYPPGGLTSGEVFWSRLFGREESDLYAYAAYPGHYAVRYVRVVQGKLYYVQLWTEVSRANTVHLSWRPGGPPGRPANDDLKDARLLVGSHGSVSGTTKGATYQPGESPLLDECMDGCGFSQGDHGQSVWFRWTPPSDGTWRLHNGELGQWAWIQVYRGGPSISYLVLMKERIGYPGSYPSTLLDVQLRGGRSYAIRYSSWSYHGPFKLRWGPAAGGPTPPPPGNDDFEAARDLGSSPRGRVRATSQWATVQNGEPEAPGWDQVDSTVWFRWTAPSTGLATVGTPDHYTETRVWEGTSLGTLQSVSATYWGESERRPTFQAQAGTTYSIQLGGPYSHGAAFDVTWDITVPGNDDVADAYPLMTGSRGVTPYWGIVRATAEPGEPPTPTGAAPERTVWMTWTPSRSGPASFVTTGDHVPALEVFTGGPVFGSMTRIAWGPFGADFTAHAGTTYWLRMRAELASIGHVGWSQKWDHSRPATGASLDGGRRRTRDTWVSLELTGRDTGSGLRGWLVSLVAANGQVQAAAWVPARGQSSRTVRWSVTHTAYGGNRFDGKKLVYVQAVDRQGNRSYLLTRSILLDR